MDKGDKALQAILGIPEKDWLAVFREAQAKGLEALQGKKPTPMVVAQHTNMLDDNSPVEKAWFVEGGACGFAWVSIRCKKGDAVTREFINAMKKHGIASGKKDRYSNTNRTLITYSDYEGYMLWVSEGGQSIQRKEAYASAFANVLQAHGVNAYMNSRLD